MIHRSIFDDIGYFDENLKVCEDYDMWLRILRKYQFGFIDEQLINKIAGHSDQLSFNAKFIDIYRIIALKKHLNSIYHKEIKDALIKKCDILIKGALKYNNKKILTKYTTLKNNLQR